MNDTQPRCPRCGCNLHEHEYSGKKWLRCYVCAYDEKIEKITSRDEKDNSGSGAE